MGRWGDVETLHATSLQANVAIWMIIANPDIDLNPYP